MSIRVYLVEDHPLVRETLADYLALSDDIEICGLAASAAEAESALEKSRAAVVVIDTSLPDCSGIHLAAEIRERWQLPCIVLSGSSDHRQVGRALAAGAQGYVLKGDPHELRDALRRVVRGEVYVSELLRRSAVWERNETRA